MARSVTEWVNVTGDISIIARESGEVWFHTPDGTKEGIDPFATPMMGAGAVGSTVGLLTAPGPDARRLYRRVGRRLSHVCGHASKSPVRRRAIQRAGEAR